MRVVSQKKDASYDFDRTEFRTSYECISATFLLSLGNMLHQNERQKYLWTCIKHMRLYR